MSYKVSFGVEQHKMVSSDKLSLFKFRNDLILMIDLGTSKSGWIRYTHPVLKMGFYWAVFLQQRMCVNNLPVFDHYQPESGNINDDVTVGMLLATIGPFPGLSLWPQSFFQ